MKARFSSNFIITHVLKILWGAVLTVFISSGKVEAKETGIFYPQTFTLQNGLKVVVITNMRMPIVTQMLWYKVGSIDDPVGKSGLAHFLEHLMFKGTPETPANVFMETIARIGGQQNAGTTAEYTYYYQNVAVEHLELVIKLEADRMVNLTFLPRLVENENKVILEERRARIDNNPSAILAEASYKAFYWHHPYGRPVIGWEHEIKNLSLEDARNFYKTWYVPNNAILIFAGAVTASQVKPLVEKYYGQIPAGKKPVRSHVKEPDHRQVVQRLNLSSPRVDYPQWERGYHIPDIKAKNPTYPYALEVLTQILSGGATSIFYENLVEGKKILSGVTIDYNIANFGPSCFMISTQPNHGHTIEEAERAIELEIAQLLKTGISKEKVEKAKHRKLAGIAYLKDNVLGGAHEFGVTLATNQTLEEVEFWPQRIKAVTVQEVNEVLRLVLGSKEHVTSLLLPEKTESISPSSSGTPKND